MYSIEKVSDVTNRSPSTRRTFCWQYGLKPEPEVFRDVIVAHFPVVTRFREEGLQTHPSKEQTRGRGRTVLENGSPSPPRAPPFPSQNFQQGQERRKTACLSFIPRQVLSALRAPERHQRAYGSRHRPPGILCHSGRTVPPGALGMPCPSCRPSHPACRRAG